MERRRKAAGKIINSWNTKKGVVMVLEESGGDRGAGKEWYRVGGSGESAPGWDRGGGDENIEVRKW